MTAKNDITGDTIASRANTKAFEDNFDAIFRKEQNDSINSMIETYQDLSGCIDNHLKTKSIETVANESNDVANS